MLPSSSYCHISVWFISLLSIVASVCAAAIWAFFSLNLLGIVAELGRAFWKSSVASNVLLFRSHVMESMTQHEIRRFFFFIVVLSLKCAQFFFFNCWRSHVLSFVVFSAFFAFTIWRLMFLQQYSLSTRQGEEKKRMKGPCIVENESAFGPRVGILMCINNKWNLYDTWKIRRPAHSEFAKRQHQQDKYEDCQHAKNTDHLLKYPGRHELAKKTQPAVHTYVWVNKDWQWRMAESNGWKPYLLAIQKLSAKTNCTHSHMHFICLYSVPSVRHVK